MNDMNGCQEVATLLIASGADEMAWVDFERMNVSAKLRPEMC